MPKALPTIIERMLLRETVEWFERIGKRHGFHNDGAVRAIRRDPGLRNAAEGAGTIANTWFGLLSCAWHLCGRPSYWVEPELLDALGATTLREAPADAVHAPQPIFLIQLPENAPVELITRQDRLPLSGVLVVADPTLILAGGEIIGAANPQLPGAPTEDADAAEQVELADKYPTIYMLPMAWGGSLENTSLAWYSVTLSVPDLEACVEASTVTTRKYRGIDTRESALEILGVVLKVMLYVNSIDAHLDAVPYVPERRPGKSAKARELFARKKRSFGSRVVLGRGLGYEAGEGGGESGAKVRLHEVRGHFKRQPHGEGRRQRKVIYVKPYWRGLYSFGRTVERRYVVGKKP